MRFKKLPLSGILLVALCWLAGCKTAERPQAPVALAWEMGAVGVEPGYYENAFILKNISDAPLARGWSIYFSQLPRLVKQEENPAVRIEAVNGNFFRMSPTGRFSSLAPGDSLRVTFRCTFKVDRNSNVPEGTYWVADADGRPLPVSLDARPLPPSASAGRYPDATLIYASNQKLPPTASAGQADILPAVKQVVPASGVVTLVGKVALRYPEEFSGEAALLEEKLAACGLEIADTAALSIRLEPLDNPAEAVNDEYYQLKIAAGGITVRAVSPHGIFNGTQTLLAMLKGRQAPYELECMTVTDYPDLSYRGLMVDVARDFVGPADMKKLVDILASYKMNVLHFHFSDDEGWRLEIPGLEELTEVGSRRGHTTDESECLYPAYDGGYDPDAPTVGNGHYSREEFIDLLKYAAERHVRVIPEIESPGHARAAIVSMKARYAKYKDSDPGRATEFLLSEPEDTSRYVSVQYYTDNVINVALPSTYRFMDKVIGEIAAMYREAGVPLTTVHLGGDEVPKGVWMGSPQCRKLMAEKGMTEAHDLSEYFLTRMADLVQAHGLKFGGWQEVALGHTDGTHDKLRQASGGVYCWSTGAKNIEVVYNIANNGYPVVLCNVGNFYMDMAYNGHPDERGLDWGGYVDEAISFSMLPFSIYRSLRTEKAGQPIDLDKASEGKVRLTENGQKNILGVQGQLFSETIRGYEWVEYCLFPKMMGLADRGWNAHPAWEALSGIREEQAFERALSLYYDVISTKEMPHWAKNGINFRLPLPGLQVTDGTLYANTPIRGAEICYTLDGTEPTAASPLWTAPVPCDASVVKAKIFYKGRESLTIELGKEN